MASSELVTVILISFGFIQTEANPMGLPMPPAPPRVTNPMGLPMPPAPPRVRTMPETTTVTPGHGIHCTNIGEIKIISVDLGIKLVCFNGIWIPHHVAVAVDENCTSNFHSHPDSPICPSWRTYCTHPDMILWMNTFCGKTCFCQENPSSHCCLEENTTTQSEGVTTTQPEVNNTTQPEDVTTTQPEGVTTTQPEDVTTTQPENVTTTQPENVTTTQPENVTTTQPEDVTTTQPEVVTTTQPEDVTTTQPEVVTTNQPEDVTTTQPDDVTTTQPEDVTTTEPENVTTTQPENVTTTQPEVVTTTQPEETTTTHYHPPECSALFANNTLGTEIAISECEVLICVSVADCDAPRWMWRMTDNCNNCTVVNGSK